MTLPKTLTGPRLLHLRRRGLLETDARTDLPPRVPCLCPCQPCPESVQDQHAVPVFSHLQCRRPECAKREDSSCKLSENDLTSFRLYSIWYISFIILLCIVYLPGSGPFSHVSKAVVNENTTASFQRHWTFAGVLTITNENTVTKHVSPHSQGSEQAQCQLEFLHRHCNIHRHLQWAWRGSRLLKEKQVGSRGRRRQGEEASISRLWRCLWCQDHLPVCKVSILPCFSVFDLFFVFLLCHRRGQCSVVSGIIGVF